MLTNDGTLCCDAAAWTFQQNEYPNSIWSNFPKSPVFSREQGNRRKVILGAFYNLGGIPIPSVLVFPPRQRLTRFADTHFPPPLSQLPASNIIHHAGLSVYSPWKRKLVLPLSQGVSFSTFDDKKARKDTKRNRVAALPLSSSWLKTSHQTLFRL